MPFQPQSSPSTRVLLNVMLAIAGMVVLAAAFVLDEGTLVTSHAIAISLLKVIGMALTTYGITRSWRIQRDERPGSSR